MAVGTLKLGGNQRQNIPESHILNVLIFFQAQEHLDPACL